MSAPWIILIVGLVLAAVAYIQTVRQSSRAGVNPFETGRMAGWEEGGVSGFTSLLMLLAQALVAVGVVWLLIRLIF